MPVINMMVMGDTPQAHISRALTTGIQSVRRLMPALFARLKVGTAMSATTAGRMPRKMACTAWLSLKVWKNMAISRMIRKEGSAVPMVVHSAPRVLLSL